MQRIGYFQNLRNFLRNCSKFFGNFSEGFFCWGIFWEKFFGGIFRKICLGGFFWEDFFGGFFGGLFLEEFFGRNYLFVKILVFVKTLSKSKKEGRRKNLDP